MNIENSENSEIDTKPEILETTNATSFNLLPEKSRKHYNKVYTDFIEWRNLNKVRSFSENVLLAYFAKLADKYKSSSLWKIYSMLRSTISVLNNTNIENYSKLRAFLKRKGEGYRAKTSKVFSPEEINKFIDDAPDEVYLATKVALIMGIVGACRSNEMYSMKMEDIQNLGSAFLISIPNTKTKTIRKFTVTDNLYNICKKYIDLRPANVEVQSFFLNYQKGKCTMQKIGINKFGSMGKQIATYLKLPNANLYTGHSFRKSSAILLVEAGGDITAALKPHGRWKSTTVAEGYIDNSMTNKMNTANQILYLIGHSNTSNIHHSNPDVSSNIQTLNKISVVQGTPSVANFNNCSNFTITFAT